MEGGCRIIDRVMNCKFKQMKNNIETRAQIHTCIKHYLDKKPNNTARSSNLVTQHTEVTQPKKKKETGAIVCYWNERSTREETEAETVNKEGILRCQLRKNGRTRVGH